MKRKAGKQSIYLAKLYLNGGQYYSQAAITGDLNKAKRALILTPLVNTGTIIDQAQQETVRENIDLMPQFTHLIK